MRVVSRNCDLIEPLKLLNGKPNCEERRQRAKLFCRFTRKINFVWAEIIPKCLRFHTIACLAPVAHVAERQLPELFDSTASFKSSNSLYTSAITSAVLSRIFENRKFLSAAAISKFAFRLVSSIAPRFWSIALCVSSFLLARALKIRLIMPLIIVPQLAEVMIATQIALSMSRHCGKRQHRAITICSQIRQSLAGDFAEKYS